MAEAAALELQKQNGVVLALGFVVMDEAGAPGEDLVGPGFESNFVAEDDGDEDARAQPVGVVGCDDEREVDCPYRREPVADRDFEGAGEGDEVVCRELADAFAVDGSFDDREGHR